MIYLYLFVLLLNQLSGSPLILEIKPNQIKSLNRLTVLNYIKNNDYTRSIIIENFETDSLELLTHGDDDIDPSDWTLTTFTPDSTSYSSLVLYGNTWKDQLLDSILINYNTVWKLDMFSALLGENQSSEIQAIGIEDLEGNRLYYSIWGTQFVNEDYFENCYQGYFSFNSWTEIILPIGMDWYDRFEYEPVINKLFYVNDADGWFADSIYFDNILDISEDLPIAPSVTITIESSSSGDVDEYDRPLQTYSFSSDVIAPDSDIEDFS